MAVAAALGTVEVAPLEEDCKATESTAMAAVVEWLAVAEDRAETAAATLAGKLVAAVGQQVAEGTEATVAAATKVVGTVVLVVVAMKVGKDR